MARPSRNIRVFDGGRSVCAVADIPESFSQSLVAGWQLGGRGRHEIVPQRNNKNQAKPCSPAFKRLARPATTSFAGESARVMQKSQQPKQKFPAVEAKSGQAADQRTVEADVLQVTPDVDLDQRDQLRHVPTLHLVGDEG